MPNTNVEDEELRTKVIEILKYASNDALNLKKGLDDDEITSEEYNLLTDSWLEVRTSAIMNSIAARERKAVELESLETGKYVASQIINGVSAQDLYSAFCKSIAELTSTKDKHES